jgi:hypothetical protein
LTLTASPGEMLNRWRVGQGPISAETRNVIQRTCVEVSTIMDDSRTNEKPIQVGGRRRIQFSLTLMLLLVVLISELLAAWALWPPPPASPANWEQIEVGMNESEVKKILGSRGSVSRDRRDVHWTYSEWRVRVTFRNGRVVNAFVLPVYKLRKLFSASQLTGRRVLPDTCTLAAPLRRT